MIDNNLEFGDWKMHIFENSSSKFGDLFKNIGLNEKSLEPLVGIM